ncbi:MAG: hypothetical protein D6772_07645 [Bacteroidetes bacterium]|nr:MAG: hypothetical protein D6772_07645 [Bacteroidota bacterium]
MRLYYFYFKGKSFLFLGLVLWCFSTCQDPQRPLAIVHPDYFVPPLIPADNPTTAAGVALGRQLFFDPILSANHNISCASCHQPGMAFTDGRARSIGFAGRVGKRSAPSLLNVGFYQKGLFWDGRSPSLEEQALHPVTDPLEMAADWSIIVARLRVHPYYPQAFQRAFGTPEPDSMRIAKALAQFQRTLVSSDAKYDRVLRGEAAFTPQEQRGYNIFFDADPENTPMAECNHCHSDPLFTNLAYENNGLEYAPELTEFSDLGRGKISGQLAENGTFKVPTLRNIALTAPYMHDGRFTSLDEVVDHYNQGGVYAPNRDPQVRPLGLNEQDKADLIAFLYTLTDSTALFNPAYAGPN